MAYLVVLAILLLLALKGYSGKKVSMYAHNTRDTILFNLFRMLFCLVIGFAIVVSDNALYSLLPDGGMAAICLLAGFSNVLFLVGWMLAIQKNAMVTVDVTLTIGSLIPALLCWWLFGEAIGLTKIWGFALIVIASVILAGYNNRCEKQSFKGVLYIILAMLGDGMISFSQQLFINYYKEGGKFAGERLYPLSVYHFYTYVFAAVLLGVLFVTITLVHRDKTPQIMDTKQKIKITLPHIALMAVFLFAATYLQTIATGEMNMPAQILYPVIKGGCLISVNVTAMLFFGEKITCRSVLGSLVALSGIVVMNLS